jgi:hypothetical protein
VKLGEAILERDGLEERLEVLEARVLRDNPQGRPSSQLLDELQHTANRVRDLNIAISWTENQNRLSDLPVVGYRIRIEMLKRLAKVLEEADPSKADELWASAHNNHKVVEAATWLIDLQVPTAPVGKSETKEVE